MWFLANARVQVGGEVHNKEPKSKAGIRQVYLDEETVEVLRKHRRQQAERRLAAGPAWQDTGYVFTRADGTPLMPETVSRRRRSAVKAAGLPTARLHDGRHTSNTIAVLHASVPERVMIERVGHADIKTNRRYQQVHEEIHRKAAEAIAAQYRQYRQGSTWFAAGAGA